MTKLKLEFMKQPSFSGNLTNNELGLTYIFKMISVTKTDNLNYENKRNQRVESRNLGDKEIIKLLNNQD